MDFYKVRTSEYRIAVVGLLAAGKTVFLTSLINHLKAHDPHRFSLGNGQAPPIIRRFREIEPETGWESFPYQRYRDAIISGKWPAKTKDRFQFACTFERSDWRFSVAKLRLYDLPGERIADAVMAIRDYAGWSDHVLSLLDDDRHYRECSGAYLSLLEENTPTDQALLRTYKQMLARLIRAFKPNVSPSTFLLDLEGKRNKAETVEEMADSFFSGLDAASEFVPLSKRARAALPELAARFVQGYDLYKNQVVVPVIAALKSCHGLIVLVDVLMLLAGGVGMYDDNRQVILDLLSVLEPGGAFHDQLIRGLAAILPHSWRPGGISRIAFVAPKLDQVWPADRDHMLPLLQHMVGNAANDFHNVAHKCFNCTAVKSTEVLPSDDGERWLQGVPLWGVSAKERSLASLQKFRVHPLPTEWPRAWNSGEFSFPDVYPLIPERKDYPPDHERLDEIMRFVMG
jgi:predicted YcjX-like family ATPase